MNKFTIFLGIGLFFSVFSCHNNAEPEKISRSPVNFKSSTGTKSPSSFSSKKSFEKPVLELIDQWASFAALKQNIDVLDSNSPGIFDKSTDDIRSLFKNLSIGIPKILDNNTIWSRIKVLETNFYIYNSEKSTSSDPEKLTELKNNILTAYQNLVVQINKTHEKSIQNNF